MCSVWSLARAQAKGSDIESEYRFDADTLYDDDNVYLSADMQKVWMLPRIPGVKTVQFTRQITTYHVTFAPLVIFHQRNLSIKEFNCLVKADMRPRHLRPDEVELVGENSCLVATLQLPMLSAVLVFWSRFSSAKTIWFTWFTTHPLAGAAEYAGIHISSAPCYSTAHQLHRDGIGPVPHQPGQNAWGAGAMVCHYHHHNHHHLSLSSCYHNHHHHLSPSIIKATNICQGEGYRGCWNCEPQKKTLKNRKTGLTEEEEGRRVTVLDFIFN